MQNAISLMSDTAQIQNNASNVKIYNNGKIYAKKYLTFDKNSIILTSN